MMQTVSTYFQSHSLNPIHFYSGQSICNKLPHEGNITKNCADIVIDLPSPKEESGSVNVLVIAAVVVPVGCILLALCIAVVLLSKRKKTDRTIPLGESGMYIEMAGKGRFKTEIKWDDDLAYSIAGSLISGKRLKLAEQIGEGQTQHIRH